MRESNEILVSLEDEARGYVLTYTGGTYIRVNDPTGRELAVQSQGMFAERGDIPIRSATLIMLRLIETGEYLELIEDEDRPDDEPDGNFDDFDKLYN